jgi:O-antigen/teichoic acid export membrane protein
MTTVLVGRLCGPSELGVYSLGFACIVLVSNLQDSLITGPFLVYRNWIANDRRSRYSGSTFVHQLVMSGIVAALLALGASTLGLARMSPASAPMIWTLAAMMPFISLYEFARKFCFAKLSMPAALAWDLVASVLQIGMLYLVWRRGQLSAATAMLAVGAAAAIAGTGWLVRNRAEFRLDWTCIWLDWQQNLAFGRWALLSQLIEVTNTYYVHWLLAFTLGTAATGLYAASMTIVQFAHPLTLGVSNILSPASARAFREGGQLAVRRVVGRGFALLAAAVGTYCLVVAFFGPEFLGSLFGREFNHDRSTLVALAGAALVGVASLAANAGLWALNRPRLSSLTSLVGLVVLVASSWLLVGRIGVLGAACSTLLSAAAVAAARSFIFLQLTRAPKTSSLTLAHEVEL